jgi:hypothetical protein
VLDALVGNIIKVTSGIGIVEVDRPDGMVSVRTVLMQAIASIPPEAPRRCPVMDLVLLIFSL